jgi:hypothetical protein
MRVATAKITVMPARMSGPLPRRRGAPGASSQPVRGQPGVGGFAEEVAVTAVAAAVVQPMIPGCSR